MSFDYGRGRFFRFHKGRGSDRQRPEHTFGAAFVVVRSMQGELTLEYQEGEGVLIKNRPDVVRDAELSQFIANACQCLMKRRTFLRALTKSSSAAL